MLKSEILLVQDIDSLPEYDANFIRFDYGETLELTSPVTHFLETLLCKLRRQIVNYELKKKRK